MGVIDLVLELYVLKNSLLRVPKKAFLQLPMHTLTINLRTSGPVNAHLTPGPGIYFNAFIHVYSPRAGAENPLGTNVDVNRKALSLCPFVASFKTISLRSDFIQVFFMFFHVYIAPGRG